MRVKRICRITFVVLLFSALASSCRKESSEPDYSYYVSKELLTSYSESYVNNLIDVASVLFPDASELKQHISSGADLYKLVYKTTVSGEKILASGIVCFPEEPGEYPVLSFQNGTNTRHSKAPSEDPGEYGYQMIEAISSMGYIVVIADYPGFGESSDIPHPYLVAEPTVRSLVDMLYALREMDGTELPEISVLNEYYLLGYSQGGWATLQMHKALELEYNADFKLEGSCCGAGPYNISLLLQKIIGLEIFPMPYYMGYVLNAYSVYHQFTNPVSDIFNEPYAARVSSLFTGQLNVGQINAQLTTSIPELVNPDFLAGFLTSAKYAPIRQALDNNSIAPWKTSVPLLMIHGDADTHVDPSATENMYAAMIVAGTSPVICKKIILPGADHSDGVIPAIIQGFLFLNNLRNSN